MWTSVVESGTAFQARQQAVSRCLARLVGKRDHMNHTQELAKFSEARHDSAQAFWIHIGCHQIHIGSHVVPMLCLCAVLAMLSAVSASVTSWHHVQLLGWFRWRAGIFVIA